MSFTLLHPTGKRRSLNAIHIVNINLMYTKLLLFIILVISGNSILCHSQEKMKHVSAKKRIPDATGKDEVNSETWESYPTRIVADLPGFTPLKTKHERSKYGGNKKIRTDSTGFFYTKKIDSRWWLVDPDGFLFIHSAVNSVHPGLSDRNKSAFLKKFQNKENWTEMTKSILFDHGFNGLGSWSDTEAFIQSPTSKDKPIVYTLVRGFMSAYAKKKGVTYITPGHTGYKGNVIYVFDPEFETFCDEYAKSLEAYKNDPNLLGYFSDNEMPFKLENLDNYLKLDPHEPGYHEAVRWLKERNIEKESITDEHRHEFLAHVADRYFSIVSSAIKKYDPNHLYLGSRFHSKERHYEKFLRAASAYIDVVSINYYRVWTPERERMKEWEEWMDKPFMVTEYYVKGIDSGLPNKSGAGWLVKTQKDRGYFYQNFNLALLESKNCVGWHYFKYQDNDPTQKGAELSNTDSNKGIVDNEYELYKPMTQLMKELNLNMYELINYFDQVDIKNKR